MKKYRVHVKLSKQLLPEHNCYIVCMAYIVMAAAKSDAKRRAEFAAQVENPSCRAKAYHVEEIA